MRLFAAILFAGALFLPVRAHADCPAAPTTLASTHDCYRPVLVFTPSADDPQFTEQLQDFEANAAAFRERNMLLVPVLASGEAPFTTDLPYTALTPEDTARTNTRFHQHEGFETVLLGKDGGEKFRSSKPISFQKLQSLIDAMPMRKQEIKQH